MTVPTSKQSMSGARDSHDGDLTLRADLIDRYGISSDMERAVHELMQIEQLSFAEAAVRLNFLTEEQVNHSLGAVHRHVRPTNVGLIESAINKIASNRQLVPAQGEKVKPGPQLILAHDADNPRSEKIRALRTELLLLSDATRGANAIALLSACAGEGRSQLAAELAISFSQLGRKALLVDADLRQPRQHVLFGSTNQTGLTNAIVQNQKPLIHPVDGLPCMSLLTSGTIAPNPLELLSDGRFARMLQDWRKSFEFVILDTPPIQAYADGLAVATLAGRVILLSRSQHTSFSDTRELLRRLAATQSQVLGAVINHF